MTSEEMTTGSVRATDAERKFLRDRSRWFNSTGGGSFAKQGIQKGNVKAGDGGAKFRSEWPELDKENWKWMEQNNIDIATGEKKADPGAPACSPTAAALARRPGGSVPGLDTVVEGGQAARDASEGWLSRNKVILAGGLIFTYVLLARIFGEKD
jgi:ubiquitin-conjugating enzyme E2 J2